MVGIAKRLKYSLALSVLLAAAHVPAPAKAQSVNYRMCIGEYESACKAHDIYEYCYYDPRTWSKAHCGSSILQEYDSYGGNKCGYAMWMIICQNPKGASDSNIETLTKNPADQP
jgi:hypothetical protein